MKSKSFTLPEILVTVSIILIMSGIAMIMISRYTPYYRLTTSSRDLISGLRNAQQLTISQQYNHRINLNQSNQSWQLQRIENGVPIQLENHQLPTGISISAINLGGQNYVEYTSSGAPIASGTITLQNSQDRLITITISPVGNIKSN